jgi:catechol 2,3-dioxygenase-like lactoylglutathione lyase family enzyme
MTIQRMDHVGVVVDDLEAATAFFVELGMELSQMPVEGRWVDRGPRPARLQTLEQPAVPDQRLRPRPTHGCSFASLHLARFDELRSMADTDTRCLAGRARV